MDVPVTPQVIRWAMVRAGLAAEDVAHELGVTQEIVEAWLGGTALPQKGKVRDLGKLLGREFAFFLRPEPPTEDEPVPDFRRASQERDRLVEARERELVRRVRSRQDEASSIFTEEGATPPFERVRSELVATLGDDAETAAAKARRVMRVPGPETYIRIRRDGAVGAWARLFESSGLFVFRMRLSEHGAEGISVHHAACPAIVLNTSVKLTAGRQVFTLCHELAHVTLRNESICESTAPTLAADAVEGWCNRFAAAFLMPRDGLKLVLDVALRDWRPGQVDLEAVRVVADRLRISIAATAVRLAQFGWVHADVARQAIDLPRVTKTRDPDDEFGIPAHQLRITEYGRAYAKLVVEAMDRGTIGAARATRILRLDVGDLDRLRTTLGG